MTLRQFLSKMFRSSDKQIDIKGSKAGIIGDYTTVENLHIHENQDHLANRIDLESEIREYCEKADTFYNNIPMVGFKTRVKVPINLEHIYVPLRAVMDIRTVGRSCFGGAEEADSFFRECREGREVPLSRAFHLAREENRTGIVILGDPGSGKTTHLKRLLLWCLRGGLKELGLPRDMIPVFLPLRNLKDLSQGLDGFIQAQLNNRHLNTPEGFGRRMLARGNLLFLFDGLDEVSDDGQRAEVCRWIEKARRNLKNCFFAVTCRFAGYREKAQFEGAFLELHLLPLDQPQAEEFIHNWYTIMEGAWQKDKAQAQGLAQEKASCLIDLLKQPEFRSRKVFPLTRNPLLLTNICLIHGSRGNLPRTRAQLYQECMDILLELWQDAKGYPSKINAKMGKQMLQPAALWLHEEEGRTRADENDLAQVLEPIIRRRNWPNGDARGFLAAVRDESGLLTAWGDGTFGFMHLGFQEYLAAREIAHRFLAAKINGEETFVLKHLARRFHESWWQEVGLLLLALEEAPLFVPFMREVVRSPVFISNPELIELCLDDAAEVSALPFIEVLASGTNENHGKMERRDRALEILRQMDPGALEHLVPSLEKETAQEIKSLISVSGERASGDEISAPKGGYVLVRIPGGTFIMGSPETEDGRFDSEGPCHRVTVPQFYMGKYPVTNEEYSRFLKASPECREPKYWSDRNFNRPNQPVVGVSFDDARAYARWAGLILPSEAQWEYACRAGTQTRYYTGNAEADLSRAGWYDGNSNKMLHSVGQKEPNEYGLYDMHGNVFEWVADQLHENYEGAPDDGSPWLGLERIALRVFRGGSWLNSAGYCRAAFRFAYEPGFRCLDLGFRLALPGQQQ